jgi:anti-sigma factor RsiW
MNLDSQLKLQAHLDGELSGKDARQMEAWLADDAEARLLAEELRFAKEALAGNEPEVKLPETREFYWSKIAREIERQELAPARPAMPWWLRLSRKFLLPAFGAAALAVLVVVLTQAPPTRFAATEVQTFIDDMGTMTFRDQSAGITMVWIYDRSNAPFTDQTASDTIPPQ